MILTLCILCVSVVVVQRVDNHGGTETLRITEIKSQTTAYLNGVNQ